MGENHILMIILFITAFLALFAVGLVFVWRALRHGNSGGHIDFEPLLYVQKRYEKIRKVTRIPCGVLYIKASDADEKTDGRGRERAYKNLCECILASFCDENDAVARVGNGEFIVLTRRSEAKLNAVIDQILYDTMLFSKTNRDVPNLCINFGAYLIPAGTIGFEETVARAKLACDEAKKSSRKYVAWDYNLQSDFENRTMIEKNLKSGIANNNFFLEFQPIIEIGSGNIVGGEVLTRLNSESKVLLPADFISVIKDKNLDAELDCYVYEKTCQWISVHRDVCKYLTHISINFSRNTLSVPNIAEKLLGVADGYGIEHRFLSVEILEDRESEYSVAPMRENICALKNAGVSVVLDDFGDGYSSFDDLKNFPVDAIKMSKSLTENIETPLGLRIFKSFVGVANGMNVKIIVEGAETLRQIEILRENGIQYVQGYFFYKPVSPGQFEKAILNNRNKQGDK